MYAIIKHGYIIEITASIERLRSWVREYFGPQIDVAQTQERRFFISATIF